MPVLGVISLEPAPLLPFGKSGRNILEVPECGAV